MSKDSTLVALSDLRWLRGFARFLASDADQADDLTQETLVKLWASEPESSRSIRPWLATVARNQHRMNYRRDDRRARRESAAHLESPAPSGPDVELARVELLQALLEEIEQLDSIPRQIICRRYFDGESAAEIARALAMPAATVRSHLHRTLKHLRERLDERGGGRAAWTALVAPAGLGTTPSATGAGAASVLGTSAVSPVLILATLSMVVVVVVVAGALWVSRGGRDVGSMVAAAGLETQAEEPIHAGRTPRADRQREHAAPGTPTIPSSHAISGEDAQRADSFDAESDGSEEAIRDARAAIRSLATACLEDIAPASGGAVTLDYTLLGRPGVGVFFEWVDIVESTVPREVLVCLSESLYGYVGDSNVAAFEHSGRWTSMIGQSDEESTKRTRIFETIVGAHLSEIEACDRRHGPGDGHLHLAFVFEPADRTPITTRVTSTDLDDGLVECMQARAERWVFPVHDDEYELSYRFELPLGRRGEPAQP